LVNTSQNLAGSIFRVTFVMLWSGFWEYNKGIACPVLRQYAMFIIDNYSIRYKSFEFIPFYNRIDEIGIKCFQATKELIIAGGRKGRRSTQRTQSTTQGTRNRTVEQPERAERINLWAGL